MSEQRDKLADILEITGTGLMCGAVAYLNAIAGVLLLAVMLMGFASQRRKREDR